MKEYWDLTRAERAALSAEDFEFYERAELMMAGIARPDYPTLPPEPEPPAKRTYYTLSTSRGLREIPIVFETAEAAQAFRELGGLLVERQWQVDQDVAAPISKALQVVECEALAEPDYEAHKADLVEAKATKGLRESRLREYRDACRKVDQALEALRADYREALDYGRRLDQIRRTHQEYLEVSGDPAIAWRFLCLAHARQDAIAALGITEGDAQVLESTSIPGPIEGKIQARREQQDLKAVNEALQDRPF